MNKTCFINRSRGDGIAFLFFYRDTFAGDGGFIDTGRSFRNDAVCRDAFSRADDHFITYSELFYGNDLFFAIAEHRGLLGSQIHQFFNGRTGFSLGAGFQVFADIDEGNDHTG